MFSTDLAQIQHEAAVRELALHHLETHGRQLNAPFKIAIGYFQTPYLARAATERQLSARVHEQAGGIDEHLDALG